MEDDANSELRQQLELTGLSYADWKLASVEIRRAAATSSNSGLIDAAHLMRAGQIVDAIDEEIRMLDEVSIGVISAEIAGQVSGVRSRLAALRDEIRTAARKMHGLTA